MKRMDQLIGEMKKLGFDHLVVSDPVAIEYLSGEQFTPDERMLLLLVSAEGNHTFYLNELIPSRSFAYPVEWYSDVDQPVERLAKALGEKVGIDKNWPAHFLIDLLRVKPEIKLGHGSRLIDGLRQRKDEDEVEAMRQASALNDLAMERIIAELQPGMSERQVTERLQEIYAEIGSDGISFNPIIGYGAHSADPHHAPGEGLIGESGSVVIDIGCRKDGFCSDMTRTVFMGEATDEFRKVYEIVRAANLNAIAAVRPGVPFSEIDKAARETIEQAGYGEYFIHRTGHSIGREVHEYGDVSSVNHQLLEQGMIFSIEPGIYLPGKFGVRIEDLVVVTEDGVEVLNYATKDLREIR